MSSISCLPLFCSLKLQETPCVDRTTLTKNNFHINLLNTKHMYTCTFLVKKMFIFMGVFHLYGFRVVRGAFLTKINAQYLCSFVKAVTCKHPPPCCPATRWAGGFDRRYSVKVTASWAEVL